MNSRKKGVLTRIMIALGIFIYVGYQSRSLLPSFDLIVMLAFFTLYLLWSTVIEAGVYRDPDEYVIRDDDKKSYIYLQISFMAALFFATIDFVGLHYTRIDDLEPYIITLGFIFFIISCLIRWWGFKSIGKFFNRRVAIYENHQLVITGAYQRIRHPLYLGSLFSFLAIPMVFNSWGAMLLMIFTAIPALVYRIYVEEELLNSYFGEDYKKYSQKTKKMIPGIW
ncbi:MAG: isoprenylcysteine carboxylmethyltransferase family protein [Syntrophomonas sp.]|nr:isoprenylcysteine carboxylmethyltransferase family protein [Syntrophomonas sp.]